MLTKYPNTYVNPTEEDMRNRFGHILQYSMAFDLDSVINDMGEPMGRWLAKEFGHDGEDIHGYHPEKNHMTFNFEIPGVSANKLRLAVGRYIDKESPSLLTTPFAVEALKHIHEVTGQEILIITARHPMHQGVTYRWLKKNLGDIPFRVYLMHGVIKDVPLKFHNVKVFVDDRYKTCARLHDNLAVPTSIIYNRPWNDRFDPRWLIRVNDLRDLIPIINLQYNRRPMDWPFGLPYPPPPTL